MLAEQVLGDVDHERVVQPLGDSPGTADQERITEVALVKPITIGLLERMDAAARSRRRSRPPAGSLSPGVGDASAPGPSLADRSRGRCRRPFVAPRRERPRRFDCRRGPGSPSDRWRVPHRRAHRRSSERRADGRSPRRARRRRTPSGERRGGVARSRRRSGQPRRRSVVGAPSSGFGRAGTAGAARAHGRRDSVDRRAHPASTA